jgi:hypothetical protein
MRLWTCPIESFTIYWNHSVKTMWWDCEKGLFCLTVFKFFVTRPHSALHTFFSATLTMTLPPVRPLLLVSTLHKKGEGGPLHILTWIHLMDNVMHTTCAMGFLVKRPSWCKKGGNKCRRSTGLLPKWSLVFRQQYLGFYPHGAGWSRSIVEGMYLCCWVWVMVLVFCTCFDMLFHFSWCTSNFLSHHQKSRFLLLMGDRT